MYVCKIEDLYYVKRMPETGINHHPSCVSFEPPAELSGLGQILGTAIQEDPSSGQTNLKLDFSLSKSGPRNAPTPSAHTATSLQAKGNKLTLRSFLHYLWDQAGLNHWSPAMAGKRNWAVIRKYLLLAAQSKIAKGTEISELLYIPELYKFEDALPIKVRRNNQLIKASATDANKQKLLIIIAEVKSFGEAHYGKKIIFKHLPDYHFLLDTDLFKRINKRYDSEIALWSGSQNIHLIAISTCAVATNGVSSVEEISLMLTNEHWIPFETTSEQMLIEHLEKKERKFLKGMRFNMSEEKPMASALLTDTQPIPCALYITPIGASETFQEDQYQLIQASGLDSWIWDVTNLAIPALPSALQIQTPFNSREMKNA